MIPADEHFLRCLEIRSGSGIVAPDKLIQDANKLFVAVKAKQAEMAEQAPKSRKRAPEAGEKAAA